MSMQCHFNLCDLPNVFTIKGNYHSTGASEDQERDWVEMYVEIGPIVANLRDTSCWFDCGMTGADDRIAFLIRNRIPFNCS